MCDESECSECIREKAEETQFKPDQTLVELVQYYKESPKQTPAKSLRNLTNAENPETPKNSQDGKQAQDSPQKKEATVEVSLDEIMAQLSKKRKLSAPRSIELQVSSDGLLPGESDKENIPVQADSLRSKQSEGKQKQS